MKGRWLSLLTLALVIWGVITEDGQQGAPLAHCVHVSRSDAYRAGGALQRHSRAPWPITTPLLRVCFHINTLLLTHTQSPTPRHLHFIHQSDTLIRCSLIGQGEHAWLATNQLLIRRSYVEDELHELSVINLHVEVRGVAPPWQRQGLRLQVLLYGHHLGYRELWTHTHDQNKSWEL